MSKSTLLRYSRIFLCFLLLCWCICIVWLSLIPHPEKVIGFKLWDKLMHASAYAILAFLSAQVLLRYAAFRKSAWLWSALAAWFFGFFMEIGQALLTRSRRASVGDIVANTVGILVIYLFGTLWSRHRRKTGAGLDNDRS